MKPFRFKQFIVAHDKCAMKVGTDSVLLGAWASTHGNRVLDIGGGSGILSLMVAQRNPKAFIDAVEVSEEAAKQASENFSNSSWSDRLKVYNQNILDFKRDPLYDMIITNPPYFINSTLTPDESRTTARHNTSLTPEALLNKASVLLKPEGELNIILPLKEGMSLIEKAKGFSLYPARIGEFKSTSEKPVERLLINFTRKEVIPLKEEITHYDHQGQWSEEYKQLTRDFYIVL